MDFDELADCGHTFCDHFDRSGPPEATWDFSLPGNGGTAALVQDQAISAPSSLMITLPVNAGNPTARYLLHENLPLAQSKVVVDVWMAYATMTTMNTEADLVSLHWDTPPAGCTDFGYYLVRDGTGPFNLQETYKGACGPATSNVNHYNVTLDNQPLTHVRLAITLGAFGTSHLTLDVGNQVGVVDTAAANGIPPSTISLELGAGVVRNGVSEWTIRYDDVLVDVDR